MGRNFVLDDAAKERLIQLETILDRAYGAPEIELGNQRDPLDEAVYILLSVQTDLPRLRLTWDRLRVRYSQWKQILAIDEAELAGTIQCGGLQHQKARLIKRLLCEVMRLEGKLSLDRLRVMADEEAEQYLLRLPGFSLKTARCILLYSLDRQVFPVDVNTFRIFKRVGILPPDAEYRSRSMHDSLQQAIPPERRRPFHVNLVVHGQRICLPRLPRCTECPAQFISRKAGVAITAYGHVIRNTYSEVESRSAVDVA